MAPSGGVISGISRSAVLLAQLVLEHFATHRLGERIGEDHPLGRLEACKSFTANIDQLPPARRIGAHRHDHRHDGLAPALVGQPDDSGLCHLGVPMEDRRYPGFPIAEVEQDGSSVITKHADTGGLVSVGTVTAQLLYEIARPAYANPDAVAHFDTIQLTQEGPDRVRISGVKGTPPPSDLKVALNYMGGYRNSMTLVLTGLDIGAKAALGHPRALLDTGGQGAFRRGGCAPGALRPRGHCRQRARHRASEDNRQGPRPQEGRAGLLQLDHGTGPGGICGLPHHHPTQRRERLRGLLANAGAVFGDSAPCRSSRWQRAGGTPSRPRAVPGNEPTPPRAATGPAAETVRAPLGTLCAARSGDKGGNANVGLYTKDDASFEWLASYLDVPRFRELLPEAAKLEVRRYELPNLRAINFVVIGLLGTGVASSTRPDPQAKGLGEYLRSRHVDIPISLFPKEPK